MLAAVLESEMFVSTLDDRPTAFPRACAIAALLATPVAFDPFGGTFGVDSSLAAKRAVLGIAVFVGVAVYLGILAARGRARLSLAKSDIVAIAFVVLAAGSRSWAKNGEDVRRDALILVGALLAGFLVRLDAARREGSGGATRALLAILIGALLPGLVDAGFLIAYGDRVTIEGASKFGSRLFPHQNVAALAYAPAAAIALAFLLAPHSAHGPRGKGKRFAAGVAFVALSFFLFLLNAKAALIGVIFGPLVFLLLERWMSAIRRSSTPERAGRLMVSSAAVAVVIGTLLVLAPRQPAVSAFLKETFNRVVDAAGMNWNAAYMRVNIWKKTFLLSDEHRFLGVGLSNFQYEFPAYDHIEPLKPHAHNQFMQVLAELGVVGLLLFVAIVTLALLHAVSAAVNSSARGDGVGRMEARAVGFAIVVFSLQAIFEPPLVFPFGALVFFALYGIATSFSTRRNEIDVTTRPLLRFAFIPGSALAILIAWVPESAVQVIQGERMRSGFSRQAAGDLDGALQEYRRAAETGFDHFLIHRTIGVAERSKERFEPALAEFRRAIELFPNFWLLHLDAAMCLVGLERSASALVELDRADALMPDKNEVRFWRGRANLKAGKVDLAIELLEAYRASVPESPEILRYTADAYYERTLRDASLTDCGHALDLYTRYQAIGGKAGEGWVKDRIDQLGHWLRVGEVKPDAAGGELKSHPPK